MIISYQNTPEEQSLMRKLKYILEFEMSASSTVLLNDLF